MPRWIEGLTGRRAGGHPRELQIAEEASIVRRRVEDAGVLDFRNGPASGVSCPSLRGGYTACSGRGPHLIGMLLGPIGCARCIAKNAVIVNENVFGKKRIFRNKKKLFFG